MQELHIYNANIQIQSWGNVTPLTHTHAHAHSTTTTNYSNLNVGVGLKWL